ncbi:MAG: aminotransferase class I/II-fold pyridoxal phosphate-dependent enzyme [Candidatus Bathyarchaeia archaeon]
MKFDRMLIEKESPEEYGYQKIKHNLSESSVKDINIDDLHVNLKNFLLCYGPHKGKKELRELIAKEYENFSPEHVLVTNGAAEALFIVALSLLETGDHVVIEHPNYPSNYRVPKFIGCKIVPLELRLENKFEVDLNELENLVTRKTKFVSLTNPNNPTGSVISEKTLKEIIRIVESRDCYLVSDETYHDLTFNNQLPHAASLSSKAISISSLSKAYGAPGIRIGHIAVRDNALIESFLALKEHINICNSVVDEEIAIALLENKNKIMKNVKNHVKTNFGILKDWLKVQKGLEYVEPKGGVVCFPRIKNDVQLKLQAFYEVLLEKYSTMVGRGRWFDMDDKYFRIGYGWPSKESLKRGLENITRALEEVKNAD